MTGRAVVWDLDGVLADTAEAHFRSWVSTLAQWEIALDRPEFDRTFGMSNRDTLTVLLGRQPDYWQLATIAGRKEHLFRLEAARSVRAMPGALRLLADLEAAGWSQALASSAPQSNIDLLIDKLGVRGQFAAVLSGEQMPASKPDPALFQMAARELAVLPKRCVVLEDAPAGVEAACRAGMHCVAVATTRPRAALAGADLVLDDLTQLREGILAGLVGLGQGQ